MQSLDIYFHISQDITISCSGKNEVHLAGYFEQREEEGGFDPNELDDDEEAEMEMEDIEDDDDSEVKSMLKISQVKMRYQHQR